MPTIEEILSQVRGATPTAETPLSVENILARVREEGGEKEKTLEAPSVTLEEPSIPIPRPDPAPTEASSASLPQDVLDIVNRIGQAATTAFEKTTKQIGVGFSAETEEFFENVIGPDAPVFLRTFNRTVLEGPVELLDVSMAAFQGGLAAVGQIAQEFGVDATTTQQLIRDVNGMVVQSMARGGTALRARGVKPAEIAIRASPRRWLICRFMECPDQVTAPGGGFEERLMIALETVVAATDRANRRRGAQRTKLLTQVPTRSHHSTTGARAPTKRGDRRRTLCGLGSRHLGV